VYSSAWYIEVFGVKKCLVYRSAWCKEVLGVCSSSRVRVCACVPEFDAMMTEGCFLLEAWTHIF